jgi:hypothetical protein
MLALGAQAWERRPGSAGLGAQASCLLSCAPTVVKAGRMPALPGLRSQACAPRLALPGCAPRLALPGLRSQVLGQKKKKPRAKLARGFDSLLAV